VLIPKPVAVEPTPIARDDIILPLFPEAEPTVGLTPNAKLLFRPVLREIELLLEDPQPGQAASLRALEVEPSKLIRNIILILLNIKCI
jgi:hypothetical protein